jgi:ATP-binding cassette subfamily G (WHITE) protein 2 (PDR)
MSFIFRTIGAVSRTMAQAMAPAALFTLMLITYTGFAIPVKDMVPWFRWLNVSDDLLGAPMMLMVLQYLNPISYAFEGE